MSRNRQRRRALLIAVAALATVGFATPSSAGSPSSGGAGRFTVKKTLTPTTRYTGAKSTSGRLAETDPTLLGRTDAGLVNVVVKLDYDATASYAGDVDGLAATSPSVTGTDLTGKSAAEVAYEKYTGSMDATFRGQLQRLVPSAKLGQSLSRVYGGVAVQIPANQVSKVLALPNVAAVQVDAMNKIQTDSSTTFIGAPTIWAKIGGQALAGKGVIFGDLDTGLWPEHPSFADNPALGSPPPKADGTPRECDFGDNPLTPATDVFQCNHKLIGGQPFLDSYNASTGGEVYPDTARDSDGHGTHTSSTAAGGIVTSAPVLGVDRGPISGVAPGAWVIEYKVCGKEGCAASDSAAAVQQAILDGVKVINFSIGGGGSPYTDVAELAFLDAYDAGITVATSAGNDGPGAGTTEHRGPWTITVAASTQTRTFQSTLTVTGGGASATFVGSSITAGAGPLPVVFAEALPGEDALCHSKLAPGVAVGKIVACQRGDNARVEKGFNVAQGGAAGMILYNPALADTETDNHWLPTVHLADGTAFVAFLTAHPGATATFTAGTKANGQGDVMAAFSSRGPAGTFLKPDITAPGVQILAGNSPTPDDIVLGPPGQYYQAIAGTSMSSPHIAGSALLLKALHPNWSPAAIKSAMMTTANQKVVKEDGVTPADPFDDGSGRVDLTKAGDVKLVFEETTANMVNLGSNDLTAINVNLPSINVPTMPGTVTVYRTLTNRGNRNVSFIATASVPGAGSVDVSPNFATVRPGQSKTLRITIKSSAPTGQYFGELKILSNDQPTLHVPVAFHNQQGAVTLTQSCDPTTIKEKQTTACTVTAQNHSLLSAANVTALNSKVSNGLKITGATGATVSRNGSSASAPPVTLAAEQDAIPSIAAGDTPAGSGPDAYLPLDIFGVAPIAVGDEEILNFSVDPYVFGGVEYTTIGVTSDGYVVAGGGDTSDVDFVPQDLPNVTRPNNVIAPYWTDLDGEDAPGIRITELGDGVNNWLVIQSDLNIFGTTDLRSMQVWIGVNGTQDVSMSYSAATLGLDAPADPGLTVGAENRSGTAGAMIEGPPTSSYIVSSAPGAPGGSVSYQLTVKGQSRGNEQLRTDMQSDIVAGTTTVITPIKVTRN